MTNAAATITTTALVPDKAPLVALITTTALVPYKAPLVALITPGAAISRATLARLLEDGHDVTAIARFHRGSR